MPSTNPKGSRLFFCGSSSPFFCASFLSVDTRRNGMRWKAAMPRSAALAQTLLQACNIARRLAVDQQHGVGGGAAPAPVLGPVLAEIAENAGAASARHAVEERERKGRETLLGEPEPLKAARAEGEGYDRGPPQPPTVVIGNVLADELQPSPRRVDLLGQLDDEAGAEGHEAQAAEDDALDLAADELLHRPGRRPEQGKPCVGLLLGHRAGQPAADVGIGAYVVGGEARIGAVPEAGWRHAAAGVALEALAVGRAFLEQVLRPREPDRVRPDTGQPGMGAGDEVLEIAFPAAAVVREKDQVGAFRRRHPA